jgi:hypothetical protein
MRWRSPSLRVLCGASLSFLDDKVAIIVAESTTEQLKLLLAEHGWLAEPMRQNHPNVYIIRVRGGVG